MLINVKNSHTKAFRLVGHAFQVFPSFLWALVEVISI